MASENRPASDTVSWLERLARDPRSVDFHVALRRIDALSADRPRLGEAARPSDELLRIGQSPSAGFESAAIAAFDRGDSGSPARLNVAFLGLWGPGGPLPAHWTELARDRARHAGDGTLASFADLFHHRMLLLFHRAWAAVQPTVAMDRPEEDAFATYVGALIGTGLPATRSSGALPNRAKLFYAARLNIATRNAEGLRAIVEDYFGVPARIEEFVGEWIDLPADGRWRLGVAGRSTFGQTTPLGARAWSRMHRFRIVLGPLSRAEFDRMLPGARELEALSALVQHYTHGEWAWDVRLAVAPDAVIALQLGGGVRLGWTSRIGQASRAPDDLVVDPETGATKRLRPTSRARQTAGAKRAA